MRIKLFAGADKNIFERAKVLRKQQKAAEEMLWFYLRTKPLGYKFRRQHPFGIYILDFYCHQLKLAIEVDGSIHNLNAVRENDKEREALLKQLDLEILRVTNNEIMLNQQSVMQ